MTSYSENRSRRGRNGGRRKFRSIGGAPICEPTRELFHWEQVRRHAEADGGAVITTIRETIVAYVEESVTKPFCGNNQAHKLDRLRASTGLDSIHFPMPSENKPDHPEIADEHHQGCPKVAAIAFDDEVSEPGKAVADHRPQQRKPRMSERESTNQDSESENGAAAVQNPIAGMAMRAQIKREKNSL